MFYEDFHLRIAPDGPDGFQVHARFREQRASAPLILPSDLRLLDSPLGKASVGKTRDLMPTGSGAEKVASSEEVGGLLFQALLGREIGRLFEATHGACGEDSKRGLRLRLHFPPQDQRAWLLQSLHWELIYHTEDLRFLALNRRLAVVRSLDTARPLRALPSTPPLQVLVAMANPPGTSRLDLQTERERIEKSLAQIAGIRIAVVERTTLRELRLRLREGCFHIVHFMGHGIGFDEESSEGALLLDSRQGEAEFLSATGLAELFEGLAAPQLVVLNACKTAVASEGVDPIRSVAASLVVAGLPAVLAQRAAIQDAAALIFSEEIYRRLAQGDPIEAAVAEARLALRSERRGTSDWAIPALFVRPDPAWALPVPAEMPVNPTALPSPVSVPVAPDPTPRFIQNMRTGRVREQTNIQGEAVYYNKKGRGD